MLNTVATSILYLAVPSSIVLLIVLLFTPASDSIVVLKSTACILLLTTLSVILRFYQNWKCDVAGKHSKFKTIGFDTDRADTDTTYTVNSIIDYFGEKYVEVKQSRPDLKFDQALRAINGNVEMTSEKEDEVRKSLAIMVEEKLGNTWWFEKGLADHDSNQVLIVYKTNMTDKEKDLIRERNGLVITCKHSMEGKDGIINLTAGKYSMKGKVPRTKQECESKVFGSNLSRFLDSILLWLA